LGATIEDGQTTQMWKRIVVVALLLSLGANVWLIKRGHRARIGAAATGSVMVGLTTGPRGEVASGLNWIGMEIPRYEAIALDIAAAPGPVAPEQRAQLEHPGGQARKRLAGRRPSTVMIRMAGRSSPRC
jgi:hypothetical protein